MTRRWRFALLAALLLAALHVASMWPGLLTWDAIRQYGQALGGRYDDWHPPAMNWLWRQLLVFGDGPAPMLVLQAALYWSGFGLIAAAAWRRGAWGAALALGGLALLPLPLMLVGTVLKDSLMAGALLLAIGLMAWRRPGARWRAILAALLLVAAATLRFNAVAACLPLLVALTPAAWRRTRVRLVLTSLAALVPLAAALPVANRLLHAERSGVALSLVIYDLGGITRFGGVDAFPPLPVDDPVAVNARCYSPVSWDAYAWWGPEPCPIGFGMLKPVLGDRAARWWLGMVAAHPLAYLRHRLAHMNANLRFWVHHRDLPPLPVDTDPNRWRYRTPSAVTFALLAGAAGGTLATPLGWPVCWIALGLGLLALRPWREPSGIAWPVLLSALLYAASFAPLSVASEVRYHLWTEIGIGIAAVLTLADARRTGVSPGRIGTAFVPMVLVGLIAVTARLM